MSLYQGTNMPELKEPGDTVAVRKGVLDLLKKINEVWDSLFPNAVYDTGTNTFGSWIRYNNGVMQCWGFFNGSFYLPTITFPVSFVSTPMINTSVMGSTATNAVAIIVEPVGLSSVQVSQRNSAGTTNVDFSWTAIGKWK